MPMSLADNSALLGGGADVLSRHPIFRARDLELAREHLSGVLPPHRLTYLTSDRRLDFRHRRFAPRHLSRHRQNPGKTLAYGPLMSRKARDPKKTGREPTPPWKPTDLCPCGGDSLYGRCCLGFDGRAYKQPVERAPPGPHTGFSHPDCYMGWTHDCDKTISGEHYISASVLKQLGGPMLKLGGVPWIPPGDTKILPISSLTANILCKRHNEGFSKLDATAGRFFAGVKMVVGDILDKKTPSMRRKWLLFGGEDLEVWLLKTAIGLFHSGTVAKDSAKLCDKQTINPACYRVLYDGTPPAPFGVYVEPIQLAEQMNQLELWPLSDDAGQRMIGLRMSYLTFALHLLFDPNAVYGPAATGGKTYRPSYLMVRNARRTHTIMLTWPPTLANERGVVLVSF
jgi:hypothetical protein